MKSEERTIAIALKACVLLAEEKAILQINSPGTLSVSITQSVPGNFYAEHHPYRMVISQLALYLGR